MIKVHHETTDPVTAWRVRDALACHPLLGGASTQIAVLASRRRIVLTGWASDDELTRLATRMAGRAAGRPVQVQVQVTRTARPSMGRLAGETQGAVRQRSGSAR